MVQLVVTNDTEWKIEWQRMTTSDNKQQWVTTNDKEWYNKWKQMRAYKIELF